MTIVNIELVPKTIDFRIVSSKAEDEEEADEFERFLMLVGEPKYTGTYKYTDIELVRGEERLSLPDLASMRISASPGVSSAVGEIMYLDEYVDDELGISHSDEIHINFRLSVELFDHLWRLATMSPGVMVSAGASFRAPETDISGHVVTWDIEKKGGTQTKSLEVHQFWFDVRVPNQSNEA